MWKNLRKLQMKERESVQKVEKESLIMSGEVDFSSSWKQTCLNRARPGALSPAPTPCEWRVLSCRRHVGEALGFQNPSLPRSRNSRDTVVLSAMLFVQHHRQNTISIETNHWNSLPLRRWRRTRGGHNSLVWQ